MYRYTTPTIPITISGLNFADVQLFRVKLEQGQTELLKIIDVSDPSVNQNKRTINLTLTQEETASFKIGKADIQVRVLFRSGEVQATKKAKVSVNEVLDGVVI